MVLVLDGGSTSALDLVPKEMHPQIMSSPLWTSQIIFDYPDAAKAMYKAYIDAGAQLVSCMTYQQSSLTMDHLNHIAQPYDVGMKIALEACQGTAASPVLTLGTHAAMLSNGAEYSHKYKTSDLPMLQQFHRERLGMFSRQPSWPRIEYIAFETLPDVAEAQVILGILAEMTAELEGKKVWISFSCSGSHAAQKVLAGTQLLLREPAIKCLWGLGINCFKEDVAEALVKPLCEEIERTDLHLIIYPDAGRQWDAVKREFDGHTMAPEKWARNMQELSTLNRGRIVLGGCCQTGPDHIRAICSQIGS